jgi:hypothetical protein
MALNNAASMRMDETKDLGNKELHAPLLYRRNDASKINDGQNLPTYSISIDEEQQSANPGPHIKKDIGDEEKFEIFGQAQGSRDDRDVGLRSTRLIYWTRFMGSFVGGLFVSYLLKRFLCFPKGPACETVGLRH